MSDTLANIYRTSPGTPLDSLPFVNLAVWLQALYCTLGLKTHKVVEVTVHSDHRFRAVVTQRISLLVIVGAVDIMLLLSLVSEVLASDAPSLTSRGVANRPNAAFSTTTTVASSQNPSQFGQTVTLTATISAGAEPVTGGLVTFTIDSTIITQTVTPGTPATASYLTSTLGVGTHAVHVDYFDETDNFAPSSGDLSPDQTVDKADTTTMLASSKPASVFGETVWFTATVTPSDATGAMQFFADGATLGSPQTLAAGEAVTGTTSLWVGSHVITATYLGDPTNFTSTSSPLIHTVNPATPILSVTNSPMTYDGSAQAATVTGSVPGIASNVQYDGSGTVPTNAASYAITADFVPTDSTNYTSLTGASAGNFIINQANTTTTLTPSVNPSVFGESVTFTATVAPSAATGTAQFYADGTTLGVPQTLLAGAATTGTTALTVGTHVITATYSGDTNFSGSTGTLSPDQGVGVSAATITLGKLSQTYDGTTKPITSTTTPMGLTVVVTYTGINSTVYLPSQTAPTNAGTYQVDATIDDANYQGAAIDMLTIAKATATLGIESSANPSVFGESVAFTATVAPSTATGVVQFYADGTTLGVAQTLVAGTAATSTTALAVGTHVITATYGGDANSLASTGTLSPNQGVGKANTTVFLSTSPNPSTYRQFVDITTTVASAIPGAGTPTGTVLFKSDGIAIGGGPLTGGGVSMSISTLSAGSHTITAEYGGDGNFNLGTGMLTPDQTVNKAATLTAIIGYAPNPSVVGQSVSITYTVLANTPYGGTPTGSVIVTDGASSCTGTVAAGNCQLILMTAGMRTLTATFQGDGNFAASPPTVGVAQTVNKAGTSTSLIANTPNPSVVGQSVTISYSVGVNGAGGGTPTGDVLVSDGTESCTGTVAAGKCQIAFSLAGSKTLQATYQGDNNYSPSAPSTGVEQSVNKANTSTIINAHTPNPSTVNQTVTVQFTVTASAPGSGTPTGNVTVTDGTANCTGKVADGSCQLSFASPGSKNLTASYGGDTNFNGSSSASVSHQVGGLYRYLPFILKGYPDLLAGPLPGAWKGPTNDEFNVSQTRDLIQGFAIFINVPSCGITNYRITHTTPEPIVNNHFSFTGSFYADVTFDSGTTAHGYDGLNNFVIPGCVTGSGGPWYFNATWQSATPYSFASPLRAPGPDIAEPASPPIGSPRGISPR